MKQKTIQNKIVVSGITATGILTIGNYLGAMQNLLALQKTNQLYLFVADLHAITVPFDPITLNKNIKTILALYIAAGFDPEQANIFIQSDVAAHTELAYYLASGTTIGELSRITQFKDKSQKIKAENKSTFIPTLLLTYPVLMAADILLYDAAIVPVGADQKQHLELTRNIAIRFNNKYQKDLFVVPEPFIPEVSRIMDLQNPTAKMSKSSKSVNGYISLLDDYKTITKKINSAVTDSENEISFNPTQKPGVSNLISIYAGFTKQSINESCQALAGKHYGFLKKAVIEAIWNVLEPLQTKYYASIEDNSWLDQIKANTSKINATANNKIQKVKKVLGL